METSWTDWTIELYDLMINTAAKSNLSEDALNWLGRLYDGEIETSDPTDELKLVVYAPEIYTFLGILSEKVVDQCTNEGLKSQIKTELVKQRGSSFELTLNDDSYDKIEAGLPTSESAEDLKIIAEFDAIMEELDIIDDTRINLTYAVDNAFHKPFYDYVATLVSANGVVVRENEDVLRKELENIKRVEMLTLNSEGKPLSEMPLVKAQMKLCLLVPPGMIRSMPTGASSNQLMAIFRAAERVGIYFLNILTGKPPFEGTLGLVSELIEKMSSDEVSKEDDASAAAQQGGN